MTAAVTVSVAGVSYLALDPGQLTARAESVAEQAACRAVDQAIAAYTSVHGVGPQAVGDLRPYVRGDISAYRVISGAASGPGCP